MKYHSIANILLEWYRTNKEKMPWRDDENIYHIWLSEIMLQQTQISTVIPYYKKWLKKFPFIHNVAESNEDTILKIWEGLGYYSRALNFHKACKTIVNRYNGVIPRNKDDFIKLKGVGKYIDSAVRSIGYGDVTPTIDGNVNRVVSRLICLNKIPQKGYNEIYNYLINIIDKKNPGDFNQALMDLGRNICKPKNPNCNQCPIANHCKAQIENIIYKYPLKAKSKKIPHYNVAVGVVWKDDNILITRRKPDGLLGGLWEFPGGKITKNETAKNCVIREIYEETGLTVLLKSFISTIKHQYSHFSISLDAFHCAYIDGEPTSNKSSKVKWISPNDIKKFAFPKANHKFINKIPNNRPWV